MKDDLYINIVNLLLGYNLVDYNGDVIRKTIFVIDYPEKAEKLIKEVYPKYVNQKSDKPFPFRELNRDVYMCIEFNLCPSRNRR